MNHPEKIINLREVQEGILLRKTILSECTPLFTYRDRNARQDSGFVDLENWPRHQLRFTRATRLQLLQQAQANPQLELLFCYVSFQALERTSCDIDHLEPYATMLLRQKAVLGYLQKASASFLSGFWGPLSHSTIAILPMPFQAWDHPESRLTIKKFFGKDKSGKIQCRRFFLRCCYNQVENLMFLKHARNLSKSKMPIGDYIFKFFPKSFQEALKVSGAFNKASFSSVLFRQEKRSSSTEKFQH